MDVLSLASAGKIAIRAAILFGDWDSGRAHRMEWAWKKLQELSVTTPSHNRAMEHLEENPELREKLLIYVCFIFSIYYSTDLEHSVGSIH